MRINKNMFSEKIYNSYKNTLAKNSKAMNNVSTGLKLNHAKDNAEKVSTSDNLKIQILCNSAAKTNIQDTNSMLQTFDGAMQEVNDTLVRMKELAVQASNGHLTATDRDAIQKELDQNVKHIDYLANNTAFNGIKLLDGNAVTKTALIGAMSNETIDISGCDLTKAGLGIDTISVIDSTNAENANDAIDKAIKEVSRARGQYGSMQSRLEGTDGDLDSKDVVLQQAQSDIADADIAEEMIEIAKSQVLMQSSISLMAQSNNFPMDALKILQNVR